MVTVQRNESVTRCPKLEPPRAGPLRSGPKGLLTNALVACPRGSSSSIIKIRRIRQKRCGLEKLREFRPRSCPTGDDCEDGP